MDFRRAWQSTVPVLRLLCYEEHAFGEGTVHFEMIDFLAKHIFEVHELFLD